MSSKTSPLLYGAYKLLGGRVAEIHPLFGELACMRNVEREEYAMCEALKVAFPEAEELHTFLEWMQKIIQIRGMAMWPRTELTDLSAKAQSHPTRQTKNMKDYIPEDLANAIEAGVYLGESEE